MSVKSTIEGESKNDVSRGGGGHGQLICVGDGGGGGKD